jgi:hypothetical protein
MVYYFRLGGFMSEKKDVEGLDEISNKNEVIAALVRDLVEVSISAQKVLAGSAIPFSLIEEARLLAAMTNEVINSYTKEEDESEEKVERAK